MNLAAHLQCCHCRDRAATARRALAQKGTKPTSAFRGVTHHVRTGRWEAHIWLDGKQVRHTACKPDDGCVAYVPAQCWGAAVYHL
jgi:hypothetical protein